MLKSLLSRLTFSNVLSMIALCVALGGVSYAAVSLPKNSVGPQQLRRHAVKPSKLAANSVAAFGDGALVSTVVSLPGKTSPDGRNTGAVFMWMWPQM